MPISMDEWLVLPVVWVSAHSMNSQVNNMLCVFDIPDVRLVVVPQIRRQLLKI